MDKTEKYKLQICKLGERQATCQKKVMQVLIGSYFWENN